MTILFSQTSMDERELMTSSGMNCGQLCGHSIFRICTRVRSALLSSDRGAPAADHSRHIDTAKFRMPRRCSCGSSFHREFTSLSSTFSARNFDCELLLAWSTGATRSHASGSA